MDPTSAQVEVAVPETDDVDTAADNADTGRQESFRDNFRHKKVVKDNRKHAEKSITQVGGRMVVDWGADGMALKADYEGLAKLDIEALKVSSKEDLKKAKEKTKEKARAKEGLAVEKKKEGQFVYKKKAKTREVQIAEFSSF